MLPCCKCYHCCSQARKEFHWHCDRKGQGSNCLIHSWIVLHQDQVKHESQDQLLGCPGVTALELGLIPKAGTHQGHSKFLCLPKLLVGDGRTGIQQCWSRLSVYCWCIRIGKKSHDHRRKHKIWFRGGVFWQLWIGWSQTLEKGAQEALQVFRGVWMWHWGFGLGVVMVGLDDPEGLLQLWRFCDNYTKAVFAQIHPIDQSSSSVTQQSWHWGGADGAPLQMSLLSLLEKPLGGWKARNWHHAGLWVPLSLGTAVTWSDQLSLWVPCRATAASGNPTDKQPDSPQNPLILTLLSTKRRTSHNVTKYSYK